MNWNLLFKMIFGVMAGLVALNVVGDLTFNHHFTSNTVPNFFMNYWGYKYFALKFELDEEADAMEDKEVV